jgi:tryptophan synthase beta subunit
MSDDDKPISTGQRQRIILEVGAGQGMMGLARVRALLLLATAIHQHTRDASRRKADTVLRRANNKLIETSP